jgi:CspA family cold shock protein
MLTDTYLDLLERRGVRVVAPVQCPTCFLGDGPWLKHLGEVKWFNPGKRYGFIITETGEEVFFHQEQLLADNGRVPRQLDPGQTVRFHLHDARKGPEALNVELGKA